MTAADRTPHVRGVAPRPTSQLWGDKSPPSGAVRISSLRGALGGGPLRTGRRVCPSLAVPASARPSGDARPGALKKWIRGRVSGVKREPVMVVPR